MQVLEAQHLKVNTLTSVFGSDRSIGLEAFTTAGVSGSTLSAATSQGAGQLDYNTTTDEWMVTCPDDGKYHPIRAPVTLRAAIGSTQTITNGSNTTLQLVKTAGQIHGMSWNDSTYTSILPLDCTGPLLIEVEVTWDAGGIGTASRREIRLMVSGGTALIQPDHSFQALEMIQRAVFLWYPSTVGGTAFSLAVRHNDTTQTLDVSAASVRVTAFGQGALSVQT